MPSCHHGKQHKFSDGNVANIVAYLLVMLFRFIIIIQIELNVVPVLQSEMLRTGPVTRSFSFLKILTKISSRLNISSCKNVILNPGFDSMSLAISLA